MKADTHSKIPEGEEERTLEYKEAEKRCNAKYKKDYGQTVKRHLKVSVNVTQLRYSPLKLVGLHGDLEVLWSHQRGVRAAGHVLS